MAIGSTIHFSSVHKTAKLLVLLLAIGVAISIIGAYTDALQIGVLSSIIDASNTATTNFGQTYDDVQTIVGLVELEIIFATIVFLIWFHKVYRNLTALGARELEFRPKWVIAYFFIPILWFYKPFKATIEIWKASDPSIGTTDKKLRVGMTIPKIFGIWWFFWVMSDVVGFQLMIQGFKDQTATQLLSYTQLSLVGGILTSITFCLTIFIVKKIDSRQEKKARTTSI